MKAGAARIVLTGASGGIGQAAAQALLKAGASVMLVGRAPDRLLTQAQALAASVAAAPGRVAWQAADLTRSADLAHLSQAAADWGANVLVHGAGLPSFGRFEALGAEELQAVLQTNLMAPMLLTQALLPHLRSRPDAQVICIGSALGRIGLPGFCAYSASKFGLRGFAEALRRELGDTTVRVQYLGPRSTRTGFNNSAVEAYNRATGTAMDTPEQVAAALLRLLESGAAEQFVGYPEKLAVRLNGAFAALMDGAFKRHRRSLPAPARPVPEPRRSDRAITAPITTPSTTPAP